MIPIDPPSGCEPGAYTLAASSATSKAEWDALLARIPAAAKKAYERISKHPLEVFGTRQFPLKGKRLKPIWEYEVTGGDRLYYFVDMERAVIVLYAGKHPSSSATMANTLDARRTALAAERKADAVTLPSKRRKR